VHNVCPNSFYQLHIYIDKDNYNGFSEKHGQYTQSAGCVGSCPSEITLIKQGTMDYQLKLDTTGYADGEHNIYVNLKITPASSLSGGGPSFTIGDQPIFVACGTLTSSNSLEEALQCLQGNYEHGPPGTWDGINVSAYLNSTSPTGRTLQITVNNIQNGVVISAIPLPEHNGDISNAENMEDEGWQWAKIHYLHPTWQASIPTDWGTSSSNYANGDEVSIFWRLTSGMHVYEPSPAFPYAIMIDGNNIDGVTSPITVPALGTNATSTVLPEIVIPSWIKYNAGWWADGSIDDVTFVAGLQWLISNEIMHIPETEQGIGSDDVIPYWIKNNAEWWADDLIDDRNFVTGLQWLITNGIMIIG
jgi:hypothetical protein